MAKKRGPKRLNKNKNNNATTAVKQIIEEKPANLNIIEYCISIARNVFNTIRQRIPMLTGSDNKAPPTSAKPIPKPTINLGAPIKMEEQEFLRKISDIAGATATITQQLDSDLLVKEELLMQSMDRLDKISSPIPSVRDAKKTQIRNIYKALDDIDKKLGRNK